MECFLCKPFLRLTSLENNRETNVSEAINVREAINVSDAAISSYKSFCVYAPGIINHQRYNRFIFHGIDTLLLVNCDKNFVYYNLCKYFSKPKTYWNVFISL